MEEAAGTQDAEAASPQAAAEASSPAAVADAAPAQEPKESEESEGFWSPEEEEVPDEEMPEVSPTSKADSDTSPAESSESEAKSESAWAVDSDEEDEATVTAIRPKQRWTKSQYELKEIVEDPLSAEFEKLGIQPGKPPEVAQPAAEATSPAAGADQMAEPVPFAPEPDPWSAPLEARRKVALAELYVRISRARNRVIELESEAGKRLQAEYSKSYRQMDFDSLDKVEKTTGKSAAGEEYHPMVRDWEAGLPPTADYTLSADQFKPRCPKGMRMIQGKLVPKEAPMVRGVLIVKPGSEGNCAQCGVAMSPGVSWICADILCGCGALMCEECRTDQTDELTLDMEALKFNREPRGDAK